MEVLYSHDGRQTSNVEERCVQLRIEGCFDAQGLDHEDGHSHQALLHLIAYGVSGIEQENDEIVHAYFGLAEVTSEPLIALDEFPEKADHLGGVMSCIGLANAEVT